MNTGNYYGFRASFEFKNILAHDLSSGDYTGRGDGRSREGFQVSGELTGNIRVLTYDQYRKDGYVINDANAVTRYALPAGAWTETKLVKVYQSDTDSTNINIGIV